ncbi:MAG: hypothetical protein ABNH00_10635 [Dokdonia sp.]|jgi:hypothetical protein
MKTIITAFILICTFVTTIYANDNNQHYLQIVLNDGVDISYPPNTGFVLQDESGSAILNPNRLKELKSYTVSKAVTLFVFPTYKSEPDVYEITSGVLYMKPAQYYKKNQQPARLDTYKNMSSNGISLLRKRFFDYDTKTGYDTSLEFSNDVVFYYRDGKAEAWQNGKTLEIEGKYLIKTTAGTLKISYNPTNKEFWYVFEKN